MATKTIKKRSDPLVWRLRQIRDGKIDTHIFCEGYKVVEEALRSHVKIDSLFFEKKFEDNIDKLLKMHKKTNVTKVVLHPDVMKFTTDLTTAAGIIGLASASSIKEPTFPIRDKSPLILILHQLQLAQNVGNLIRTAEAAGVNQVWLTPKSANPYGPKAIRGSVGSIFRVPIRRNVDLHSGLKELHDAGFTTIGSSQEGTISYEKINWRRPLALIMGPEGSGFSIEEAKYMKESVLIPMSGQVESLNVGTAAAVCLFEAKKQRNHAHKTKK